MKLTEREIKVIKVYKEDDFVSDFEKVKGDGWKSEKACTWLRHMAEDCGFSGKEFSGVMSSMVQKGLIFTDGICFGLTIKGIKEAEKL